MFIDLQPGTLLEPLTGRRWDRAEILRQVLHRASALQASGVESGDRVFLLHGNRLEFFADLLAVWNLGACAIPVDARLTAFEVQTLAGAAKPKATLFCESLDAAVAAALAGLKVPAWETTETAKRGAAHASSLSGRVPALDEDALVLFTSGTTGQPKGVVHTHRSLRARWISLRHHLGVEKYRRTLCLLPTHFGHGLICNCLFPWLSGQDLYILPPFKPETVMQLGALLDEHAITFMSSVPSVWRVALKMAKPPGAGTLRRVFCGSAPLSGHTWREIQAWAGTNDVCNSYGITETGSWVAGTTVPDLTPDDGLIGVPWGATVKILKTSGTDRPLWQAEECRAGESGYVWLNTPALMKGYLHRDDLTSQVVSQGWFMTGDIGILDDRGYLYLRGREREEINKGGMKVYPGDVDAVVERFEGVMDVCTFPCEDSVYGQNIGLAVVMKEPNDEKLRRLHAWMKQHLARHQMPVRWHLIDAIPRTSRGKINRLQVAEECATLPPLNLRQIARGEL